MSAREAIVTMTVGPEHSERWERFCEANWRAYADRHGYDLIRLERPLDDSRRAAGRSPSWQKLLVLSQPFARDYERIVWVDSDILFGLEAPAVTGEVPVELVGAVDELATPTPELRDYIHPAGSGRFYAAAGLPESFDQIVQGGLLVLSPEHHRELLERVYAYDDPGPRLNYEMRPLSYELIRSGKVHWLDTRFNLLWGLYKAHRFPELLRYWKHPSASAALDDALREVWGVHFAGATHELDHIMERLRKPRAAPAGAAGPTRAPVVLFAFARPDTTARVLDGIRAARPERLLLVANAPRPELPEEVERAGRVRELLQGIDWDCEVSTNYAETHLDQKSRIESGLDWVFEQAEEAVVLEDDCVPDPSFFAFCDELLDRHRDDERVMSISGDNFQFDLPASEDSYYLSRYPHTWGWATWRRAWEHYDPEMSRWPELRDRRWLDQVLGGGHAVAYWTHLFEQTWRERDAWDRAWVFASLLQGGLHAIPNVNLVTNIGFREDATHTRPEHRGLFNDLPAERMTFPLRHPAAVEGNTRADEFTEELMFSGTVKQVFGRLRATRRHGTPRAEGRAVSLRVLHLIPQLSPGGGGRAALAAAGAAAQSGLLSQRIASLRPAHVEMRAAAEAAGIGVLDAPSAAELWEPLRTADVVHLHYWSSPELWELLEAELPPMRLVLWPHVAGHTPPQLVPPELIRAADLPVGSSELSASRLQVDEAADVEVIPPVPGWERLEGVRRSDAPGFNVGYLGTVGFVKLDPRFAEICAAVRVPEARFLVCGAGDAMRSLPRQMAEAGLADRFVLRPHTEAVGDFYADLDLFAYPLRPGVSSSSELALKEAMYAGVPPVVLPHGNCAELVTDGETGVVATGVDSFARAIERLHADPDERERLGRNAAESARKLWDPAVLGSRWADAYDRLAALPKSSRTPVVAAPEGESAGAIRFARGLGPDGEVLLLGIDGGPDEQDAADRRLATCSRIVGLSDGGLIDHRRRYPGDPTLALWAGIFLRAQGRTALAAGQLADAARLGAPHRRVAAHLDEIDAGAATLASSGARE